jgi:hypothetical protein
MIGAGARVSGSFDTAGVHEWIDLAARETVKVGAEVGAEVAREVAHERTKTGKMGMILIEPTRPTPLGVCSSFASYVRHAWYQADGTLGNRRKRLKNPGGSRKARTPGTGVYPLPFLYNGADAGRAAMCRFLGITPRRR